MAESCIRSMMADGLVLEGLTISTAGKRILHDLDLNIKTSGLSALMGPMGSGKSTLIKFLAGHNSLNTLNVSYQKACYCGQELAAENRPVVIFQKVRNQIGSGPKSAALIKEIKAATARSARLLCVDEPTAGLSAEDGKKVMGLLKNIAKDRAVLVVSHNTGEISNFSDHVALIAGGRVVCALPTALFFDGETDKNATHFLKTGGLDIPYANTPVLFLSPDARQTPDGFDHSVARPGTGVENWVKKGQLSLMTLPVYTDGTLEKEAITRCAPNRKVFHFHHTELAIYQSEGKIEKRFSWQPDGGAPDRNPALSAEICLYIEHVIHNNDLVLIDTAFNQNAGAAILGAYLIKQNFSPADALVFTANKFPDLHLGMRIEHFLWDMDIEFSV